MKNRLGGVVFGARVKLYLSIEGMHLIRKVYSRVNPYQGIRGLSIKVFNRDLKRKHREHALNIVDGQYYDYLREESASNIVDRVEDITRSFPKALELGSYRGTLYSHIASRESLRGAGGIGGISELVQCDMANSPEDLNDHMTEGIIPGLVQTSKLLCDEEGSFPFPDHSFDLVLSSLNLHWVNDLPASLIRIKKVLKPDGAFIASMFGGNTLKELRYCFYLAEKERRGGVSSHASPLAKASDVAGLMQGAGFAMPTVDIDTVTVTILFCPFSIL